MRSASVHTSSHFQVYEPTQGTSFGDAAGASDTGRPPCAVQVIYRRVSVLSGVPDRYEPAALYARYTTLLL
jgi:hypothetical protein